MTPLKRAGKGLQCLKTHPLFLGLKRSRLGCFLGLLWSLMAMALRGVRDHKIGSQAAALSYYSLMSLGPLVALAVLVSSFVFKDQSEALASQLLSKAIVFIAPSMSHLDLQGDAVLALDTASPELNPQVLEFIDRLVQHAQSSKAGFLGTAILIGICIQLIITIEKTLNMIWATPEGRPLFQRITAYWAFLSLGTMIGFVGFSFLSKSIAKTFFEGGIVGYLGSSKAMGALQSLAHYTPNVGYFLVIVGILALFYRYLPYTLVKWKSAVLGGVIAASLLFINNYLSFLYIQKALQDQSLYGSIGIIFVLMFGLFVFWAIMLLGGEFSYVFQHMHRIKALSVWENCSLGMQELLQVRVFLHIARCFHANLEAPSLVSIAQDLKLPLSVVEQGLQALCKTRLINALQANDKGLKGAIYQVGQSLESLSLMAIKEAIGGLGEARAAYLPFRQDPLLKVYQDASASSKLMLEPLSRLLDRKG